MILIFQFRDLRKRLSKEALNIGEQRYGTVYRVKLKLLNRYNNMYDIIISRCVLSWGVGGGVLYNNGNSYYWLLFVVIT